MAKDEESKGEVCPLDSRTRAAWLESQADKKITSSTDDSMTACKGEKCPSVTNGLSAIPKTSLWTTLTSWLAPSEEHSAATSKLNNENPNNDTRGATGSKLVCSTASSTTPSLGQLREVSSIPRTQADRKDVTTNKKTANVPANCESESGLSAEGNWIYPSERMFFDAMRRKGYRSEARDMKTIVPIHNAVNEQTWKEIKEWEKPWGSSDCGGPKLHSFKGLSSSLTPKARLNTWLGYMAPFDRHDWIIDRCGKRVEYVIDFYAGKDLGKKDQKLNFFLDVRPKLNTWEGCKMRAAKALGIV